MEVEAQVRGQVKVEAQVRGQVKVEAGRHDFSIFPLKFEGRRCSYNIHGLDLDSFHPFRLVTCTM